MAKEFEHYNDKYRRLAGTALKTIEKQGGKVAREDIAEFVKWDEKGLGLKYIGYYSNKDVANAVYVQDYHDAIGKQDRENWQMFRVSLKGLSTKEKLYCVAHWWCHSDKGIIAQIRVNNYIGALVRGGQLKANLEVQR